jgi:hypothetical protein
MWTRVLVVLAPGVVAFAACGRSRVPEPSYGEHPRGATEAVCVPYPPPAAKVEETGAAPSDRAVWVDGDWKWKPLGSAVSTKGKWEWSPGAWVEPPFGASYARSSLVRMPNGALAWYPAHWHLPSHYDVRSDAAGPMASTGLPLSCPEPERHDITGMPPPLIDAGDAHVGPALLYPADAPPQTPPKVILDAVVPSDSKEEPKLIAPPE